MALPVTISADVANQNSYHGPFKSSGGAFYTIVVGDTTATDGDVEAHKATDPTSSFAEQDGANRPTAGTSGTEIASLWVSQANDLLNVVYQEITTNNDVYFAQFNMAVDAWVDLGTSDFDIQIEAVPDQPSANACSIGTRSDSDIVVAYQGDSDMITGTEYERIDMNVSTNDGPTWSGPTSLDSGGEVDWTGCVIVPGSSDRMHVFFEDNTLSDGYQRRINSDDSLETFPSTFDSFIGSGSTYSFGPGVSYDDGGTQRVRCPYGDGGGSLNVAKLDSGDTPTVTHDDSVNGSSPGVEQIGGGGVLTALAVDTKNLLILWSDVNDNDLYSNTNDDDAGWSAAGTEELDAVTVNHISSNVYDRSGIKLAYIYDDGGTVKYNEIDLATAGTVAITGHTLTVGQGTVTTTNDLVVITGHSATLVQGTIAVNLDSTATLIGHGVTLSQGTIAPTPTVNLSGHLANLQQGTITFIIDDAEILTGHAAVLSQGALGLLIGPTVDLTGHAATLSQGTITLIIDNTEVLTGHAATLTQGTLTSIVTANLVGHAITLSQGTLSLGISSTLVLTGHSATLSQGTVTAAISAEVLLIGVEATVSLGFLKSLEQWVEVPDSDPTVWTEVPTI